MSNARQQCAKSRLKDNWVGLVVAASVDWKHWENTEQILGYNYTVENTQPKLYVWNALSAAHSESLTHLQSACLTRSHSASPSSSLSTAAENTKIFFFYFHNYSVFLYLLPPPSTQRLQHYLQIRTPSLYPRPATRIKRYTSFIHHALLNYQ